jgi:16S rRNA processing protein RimM
MANDNFVKVGTFASPFGVHGWIKINSATSPIDSIINYLPWHIETNNGWQAMSVKEAKRNGDSIIALVEGYETREKAATLTNSVIGVNREQLPETNEGEVYWADLEGLTVINKEGTTLGKVDHLFETGANDIMVVVGEQRHLLPYIMDSVILKVDLEQQQILVDWDENFLA